MVSVLIFLLILLFLKVNLLPKFSKHHVFYHLFLVFLSFNLFSFILHIPIPFSKYLHIKFLILYIFNLIHLPKLLHNQPYYQIIYRKLNAIQLKLFCLNLIYQIYHGHIHNGHAI